MSFRWSIPLDKADCKVRRLTIRKQQLRTYKTKTKQKKKKKKKKKKRRLKRKEQQII